MSNKSKKVIPGLPMKPWGYKAPAKKVEVRRHLDPTTRVEAIESYSVYAGGEAAQNTHANEIAGRKTSEDPKPAKKQSFFELLFGLRPAEPTREIVVPETYDEPRETSVVGESK